VIELQLPGRFSPMRLEQKRTAVDRGIADILAQFGAEYEITGRVQRIVYLANNPRAAVAYNALNADDKRSVIVEMMDEAICFPCWDRC